MVVYSSQETLQGEEFISTVSADKYVLLCRSRGELSHFVLSSVAWLVLVLLTSPATSTSGCDCSML